MTNLTNTERLIETLKFNQALGVNEVLFSVGRYTGNNPSVIRALKARGYQVDRVPPGIGSYKLYSKDYANNQAI